MAFFLVRCRGKYPGFQARVHGSSVECKVFGCPCHERPSVFFGDARYGGPEITRLLAQNVIYRWKHALKDYAESRR